MNFAFLFGHMQLKDKLADQVKEFEQFRTNMVEALKSLKALNANTDNQLDIHWRYIKLQDQVLDRKADKE